MLRKLYRVVWVAFLAPFAFMSSGAYAQMPEVSCATPQLQAQAKKTGKINVKDAGAKGDGLVDDRGSIQQAIDCAFDNGAGYTVYFPPGNYKISAGLNLLPNVDLAGEGIGLASVILPSNLPIGTSAIAIDGSKLTGGWAFKNTLKGLNIDMINSIGRTAIQINNAYNVHIADSYVRTDTANSTGTSTVAAVDINNSNHITLDHNAIYGEKGIGAGLNINDSWVTIINADIQGHASEVIVSESAVGKGKLNMYGGYIERFGVYGIRFSDTSFNRIDGVVVKVANSGPHGVSFSNSKNNILTGVSILCGTAPCTAVYGGEGNNLFTSLIQGIQIQ